MVSGVQNQYTPDYVSPPGETLLEKLQEISMSQAELAKRMGRHKKTVNEIVQGKAPITPGTALQLEAVLGIPATFWNTREVHYRQHLAQAARLKRLGERVQWLERFPAIEMIRRGWIAPAEDHIGVMGEMLRFFGVSSPAEWEDVWKPRWVAFRRSRVHVSDEGALAAWLRRGEIEAQSMHCEPFSNKGFREALMQARALTTEPPEAFVLALVQFCAAAGVAVVFVPQLPSTRASGATRWLAPDKALIQLSLRYRTDDHLWFTFFHEAGHILLHGKRMEFLEEHDEDDIENQEADEFASRMLIPPGEFKRFLSTVSSGRISKAAIIEFAAEIGVAPGIVVGRLQHDELLPFSHCNDLKRKLQWVE